MALLGTYVGVIPVLLGMLWLPLLRRSKPSVIRVLIAFTIGLLVFLIVDALLEGIEIAGQGSQAFGGQALVYLGAIVGYLALATVDVHDALPRRGGVRRARRPAASTSRCSSPSGSASTTSARASRSAPPTPPAPSRSVPCS